MATRRERVARSGRPFSVTQKIGFTSVPINVAFVMVENAYGPLRSRQLADPLLAGTGGVENNLMTTLAVYTGFVST
jgi:hypothetical protein